MDANLAIIIGIAVLALVVGAAIYASRRKSLSLRDRYGAEYSNALHDTGGRRKAEAELRRREKRVSKMPLRALRADEMELFQMRWRKVQAHFVDNPGSAISQADRLLEELMDARGYTSRDFEQRADDLSVDHAHLVSDYRAAHEIIQRPRVGDAGTEDMRRAMIHYRALFEDLLEVSPEERMRERRSFDREERGEDRDYELRDEDYYARRGWDRDRPDDGRPHH